VQEVAEAATTSTSVKSSEMRLLVQGPEYTELGDECVVFAPFVAVPQGQIVGNIAELVAITTAARIDMQIITNKRSVAVLVVVEFIDVCRSETTMRCDMMLATLVLTRARQMFIMMSINLCCEKRE